MDLELFLYLGTVFGIVGLLVLAIWGITLVCEYYQDRVVTKLLDGDAFIKRVYYKGKAVTTKKPLKGINAVLAREIQTLKDDVIMLQEDNEELAGTVLILTKKLSKKRKKGRK